MRSSPRWPLAACLLLSLCACRRPVAESIAVPEHVFADSGSEPIVPLPVTTPSLDAKLVALGEQLYSNKALSSDGTVSCASCHDLEHGGASPAALGTGAKGKRTAVNVPSIFNMAWLPSYGWFGTVRSLDEAVGVELAAQDRMGSCAKDIVARLSADPAMVKAFGEAFPRQGLGEEPLKRALVEFVRSLSSPNSKFDRWLRAGDAEERKKIMPWTEGELGFVEFKSFGCASCHQGIVAGGNLLAKMSLEDATVYEGYGEEREADPGRFSVTGVDDDRHVLRVPSLRNVACTAPYFHDGSAATLEEAIRSEAIHQVGHRLNKEQIEEIATFLRTLTGEYKGRPL